MCLTCGARARSVETVEVDRARCGRSGKNRLSRRIVVVEGFPAQRGLKRRWMVGEGTNRCTQAMGAGDECPGSC